MAFTLLVGAEGCAETEDANWMREATVEEAAEFHRQNPMVSTIDGIGRPYWLMTVTDDAPLEVLEYVKTKIRVLRVA
jgi:hypothetical protein